MTWRGFLDVDPIPVLLESGEEALCQQVRRCLLDEVVPVEQLLWNNPEVETIVRKQQAAGCWRYSGQRRSATNYELLETFRVLRLLVWCYGLDRRHPAIEAAAGFIFSHQTAEGDIRGILGNQTMPYYHGALVELLVLAGYGDDQRVHRALSWLLSVRQDDGGWIVPVQALPSGQKVESLWSGQPIPLDRTRPFSHMATGMVLRGLSAHPTYRRREEVIFAAEGLKSRLFRPDKYNDRKAPAYWTKFQFPYWWTDLVSTLDILSRLGFSMDANVARALEWFQTNQEADSLWPTGYGKGRKAASARRWVGYNIGRVLKLWLG